MISQILSADVEPKGSGMSLRAYIPIGLGAPFLTLFILEILWFCDCLPRCWQRRKDPYEEELPSGTFILRQIKFATDDFNQTNKIGEGGFGHVFKGVLSDGRFVTVKQLSSKSRQGNREFLNEIGAVSCLQHPNLVNLHGFCVEWAPHPVCRLDICIGEGYQLEMGLCYLDLQY